MILVLKLELDAKQGPSYSSKGHKEKLRIDEIDRFRIHSPLSFLTPVVKRPFAYMRVPYEVLIA